MSLSVIHAIHSIDPAHGGTTEAVRLLCPLPSPVKSLVISSDDPARGFHRGWPCPVRMTGPAGTKFGWSPRWGRELHPHLKPGAVVVIHGLWQYHALVAARQARRAGVPWMVFPHGMLDPWAMRQSRWKKRLAWWAFNRGVVQNAACVCFTTEDERRLASRILGRNRRGVIVPLGVDAPPASLEQLRQEFNVAHPDLAGRRIFLFLGRLHPKKGCDMLLSAFARWRKEVADGERNIHLRLAGPAHDVSYLAELEAQCRALGLRIGADITFPGMVNGRDKWCELARAEVLVLPSHQENFGIVVAEALACEVPVLLSDKVNTSPLVQEFRAGAVADDSIEGTAKLLHAWTSRSAEEQACMRANARELYVNKFSAEQARNRFLDVAQTVVSGCALDE